MLNLGIRKFALCAVIAILAFASCVNDTLKEANNGSAIDFRVATMTRATETTAANIETFYVTARIPGVENNYFTSVPYMKASDDIFVSSEPYFWPAAGELQFYAYTPTLDNFGSDARLTINSTNQKVSNFVTASYFEDQKDFIVAVKSSTKQQGSSGVQLQFEHKLSQIEVHARNSNLGYQYKIAGVKIGGMASKGDFNFSAGNGAAEWVVDTDSDPVEVYETYTSAKELGPLATNIMGPNGNAMLIPQQLIPWDPANQKGAYIAVYAQIKTAEGAIVYPRPDEYSPIYKPYDWLVVPIDTEWQSGSRYIYTLDFSVGAGTDFNGVKVLGDEIRFALDKLNWNNTSTVQTTAADFIGTWDVVLCESWRQYKPGTTIRPDWPPYDLYDTEDELSSSGKVPQEMRRTRVLSEDVVQLYPGIDGWETSLGFRIQDGYLYITAKTPDGEIQESKYLIINYSKDSFIMQSEDELNDYYMQKVYYYKKVSDNEEGQLSGKWKLERGLYFSGIYNPYSNNTEPDGKVDISSVDSRLLYLDITADNSGNGYFNGDVTTIVNNQFNIDSTTYSFTDVKTSTMLVKFDYESMVGYMYYSRVE